MLIGTLAAIANGFSIPIFAILFGNVNYLLLMLKMIFFFARYFKISKRMRKLYFDLI